jgi:subtilisin family serine protease
MNPRLWLPILSMVLFTQGCKVQNQKKEDVFASGALPRVLFEIANQIHELVSLETQVVQNQARQCQVDCLDVAVIDCGVDLAHPDLFEHIRFETSQGHITGAGYDFLGEDHFASSSLIDATLFAFGSEDIVNGRIVNPPSKPLDLIESLDNKYMTAFLAAVQAEPRLKGTLFDQLEAESTSMYEMHKMIVDKDLYLQNYSDFQKINNGAFKHGDLGRIHLSLKPTLDPALFAAMDLKMFRGSTAVWMYLDGFDIVIDLAAKTLANFSESQTYQKALNHLISYMDGREFSPGTGEKDRIKKSLDKLMTALNKKLFGHHYDDKIYDVVYNAHFLDRQKQYISKNSINQDPAGRKLRLQNSLDEVFQDQGEYFNYISGLTNLSLDEKQQLATAKKVVPKIRNVVQWVEKDRKITDLTTEFGYKPNFDSDLYRQRFIRAHHPFVSEYSEEESHGSHVSGIILSQSPHLRIVPIRVSTESLQLPNDIRNEIATKFENGFSQWLAKPLVFRAIGSRIQSLYPQWNFADTSEAHRLEIATKIIQELDSTLRWSVEQNVLDHIFIDEIIKAIHYVGSQKIKVANISLGTQFERDIPQLGADDPLANLKDFFNFLKFEYFKYRIGEEIKNSATATVFVVAAGNDSTWVDGESRSALPVDISSPFLRKQENSSAGEIAPNNHLTNILAVGSLGSHDQLSSFTNIFIGQHVPFVFARGENILSSIKSTDLNAINQALKIWEPNLNHYFVIDPSDDRIKPFLIKKWQQMKGRAEVPSEVELKYMAAYLNRQMVVMGQELELVKNHLAVKYSEHRAVMSGTSMAAPTVAGALGKLILEKKARLGLQGQDIYGHPDFTAEALVQELLSQTEPLDVGDAAYGLRKLVNSQQMGYKNQDLNNFLKSLDGTALK